MNKTKVKPRQMKKLKNKKPILGSPYAEIMGVLIRREISTVHFDYRFNKSVNLFREENSQSTLVVYRLMWVNSRAERTWLIEVILTNNDITIGKLYPDVLEPCNFAESRVVVAR